jgi:hypothetical protein
MTCPLCRCCTPRTIALPRLLPLSGDDCSFLRPEGTVHIITDFVCSYDGAEAFRVTLEPGLSANPYFSFFIRATRSGAVDFLWRDQDGTITRARRGRRDRTPVGYSWLSPETQGLQDDEFANPGMLWVEAGKTLWNESAGASGKSFR